MRSNTGDGSVSVSVRACVCICSSPSMAPLCLCALWPWIGTVTVGSHCQERTHDDVAGECRAAERPITADPEDLFPPLL